MGNVVERNSILMRIWGADTYFNARSLSVYINHLRKYLGDNSPIRIMSVHGKGYKMVTMDK
jgi:DNA-binding response OmpR family regulator